MYKQQQQQQVEWGRKWCVMCREWERGVENEKSVESKNVFRENMKEAVTRQGKC